MAANTRSPAPASRAAETSTEQSNVLIDAVLDGELCPYHAKRTTPQQVHDLRAEREALLRYMAFARQALDETPTEFWAPVHLATDRDQCECFDCDYRYSCDGTCGRPFWRRAVVKWSGAVTWADALDDDIFTYDYYHLPESRDGWGCLRCSDFEQRHPRIVDFAKRLLGEEVDVDLYDPESNVLLEEAAEAAECMREAGYKYGFLTGVPDYEYESLADDGEQLHSEWLVLSSIRR